jgi:hypothetical protein
LRRRLRNLHIMPHPRIPFILLAIIVLSWPLLCHSQGNPFFDRLSLQQDITIIQTTHPAFESGYFILSIPQPLNHKDPNSATFSQRAILGVHAPDAPTVMVLDGYGVDYALKPDYHHELAKAMDANILVVEHRYFGKSQPAQPDYRWLTVEQSAADAHAIKSRLDSLLTGKWISTGTSKGGQAALTHRMEYPADVAATVVYGTAVKKSATISTGTLLKPLMETGCGQRLAQFQLYCFQHKDSILPAFIYRIAEQELDFGDMELEVVLDYALLEFPYAFWQMGGDCAAIPQPSEPALAMTDYLIKVVSPKYYTPASRKKWAPAYYMFYHELGYYEYDVTPFTKYLKQAQYPNQYFAPAGVAITFDRSHLQAMRDFLESPAAHSVYFIYGENDPWALQSIVTDNKFVVPGGNHRSKMADLPSELQAELLRRLQR